MKSLTASILRFLFKFSFFKHYFYAIHKRVFAPFNLFKGVVKRIRFKENILLKLHIDDWIQENIYFLGTYEEAELQYIKSVLKKGDTFIDIGANIGVHSLFASKIAGEEGRVISFEPFQKNYNSFKENIRINDVSNITAENLAISKENTLLNLYYNDKELNLGMVSSIITEHTDLEEIAAVSLDNYLKKNPLKEVDFIKIDIEGGEYNALLGMKKTLDTSSPKLLIEILAISEQSDNKENIEGFLRNSGYEKYFIDNNGVVSSIEKNNKRMNFVFIKT